MREIDYFKELNQSPRQQEFLTRISESRGYPNNDLLNSFRAVFIPNMAEMYDMLHNTTIYPMLYTSTGMSYIPGKLLIPGFTPSGHLLTYVAYDAIARMEAKETGIYDKPYYFYPEESKGFKKSNFLLMPYEMWQVALETKKIGIADGVFDSGSVCLAGLPCGANLGTTLGKGVKKILTVFDEVTVFKDNDSAGTELYNNITKAHHNVKLVKVPANIDKDIDGYILNTGLDNFKASITPAGTIDLLSKRFDRFR